MMHTSVNISHERSVISNQTSETVEIDTFEKISQVGEGTYGKVYKAKCHQSGDIVALKRIKLESEKEGFPLTAMREVRLLQFLDHPHILSLRDIISSSGSVYMVFDYMDYDLTGILNHPGNTYQPQHIKCILKQILEGLAYLHHRGILHRDIKGSNILLNSKGELKLADFGLARLYGNSTRKDRTNRVITLWYRPPELLLGATEYGFEVDIWGVGCILLELVTGKPPFAGTDEISQLDAIYSIMGTPSETSWPNISALPWFNLVQAKTKYVHRLKDLLEDKLSPVGIGLVMDMLSMNPSRRISAANALLSPYFTEEPKACAISELPSPEGDWHEYEYKQRKKEKRQSPGVDLKSAPAKKKAKVDRPSKK